MNQPCFRHRLDFNRCTKKLVAKNPHWKPVFGTQSPFHVEDWYSDSLKPVCQQSFKGLHLHRIVSQSQDVLGKNSITEMLPFCHHEWCISVAINRNSFEKTVWCSSTPWFINWPMHESTVFSTLAWLQSLHKKVGSKKPPLGTWVFDSIPFSCRSLVQ